MNYQNLDEITRNYRFFIIGYGPAYKPKEVRIYVGTHHNSYLFQHAWIMSEINKTGDILGDSMFDTICINHYTQAIYGKEPKEIVDKLCRICSEHGMSYKLTSHLWNASIFDTLSEDGFYVCHECDYDKLMPALLTTHRLCKLFELNDDVTISNIQKIIATFYSKKDEQDMLFNQFRQKLIDAGTTRYHKD